MQNKVDSLKIYATHMTDFCLCLMSAVYRKCLPNVECLLRGEEEKSHFILVLYCIFMILFDLYALRGATFLICGMFFYSKK